MNFTPIIDKAKRMLINPKQEWSYINNQPEDHQKVLMNYLFWLSLIPTLATFIRYGLSDHSLIYAFKMSAQRMVWTIGGAYIFAWVISALAESFGTKKNFNKAFQLVAYSYSAVCIGGIFYIHWYLAKLVVIFTIYSLYTIYTGMKEMTGVSNDKITPYFAISLICMAGVSFISMLLLRL